MAILNFAILIQLLHCGIQTPCFLLSDSLKNTLPLLWLWLKLIQSDSNSFILTQLDDGSHLEFCHLEFGHLGISHHSFSSQTALILAKIGSHHLHKKNYTHTSLPTNWTNWLHSFILTQLDDGGHLKFGHLEFCHLGFSFCIIGIQTPCYLLPDSLKNTPHPLWFWLKLIQSDSNSFILTQLDDGGHLEFLLEFCHLGFSFCIMEFRHLVFTPADSLKNTLPPLWLWLKLIQSDSNSFIHTGLDDGSHLEFCHVGFRHCHVRFRHLVIFSQIHSKILSIHSDSDLN